VEGESETLLVKEGDEVDVADTDMVRETAPLGDKLGVNDAVAEEEIEPVVFEDREFDVVDDKVDDATADHDVVLLINGDLELDAEDELETRIVVVTLVVAVDEADTEEPPDLVAVAPLPLGDTVLEAHSVLVVVTVSDGVLETEAVDDADRATERVHATLPESHSVELSVDSKEALDNAEVVC
jgi:hypothetical protein